MASIFSKIVNGEIPCYKVAETENCLAFLDVFPLAKGHVLVIPKQEIDNIFELEDTLYQELFLFAKKVSKGVKAVVPCTKIGIAVIGLEVPHAHIHLVPINNVSDMDFSREKLSFDKEDMTLLAQQIAKAIH